MAFNQTIAFEVDNNNGGASDSNGGGFDDTSGSPGTNYAWGGSQAVTAYTDLASVGAGALITSVAHPFGANHVGNVINITGGTNFTTGRYQVISVNAGTHVATVDRNCTTGVGASGTGNLGGSLLTIQTGINAAFINAGAVADCRVYIKKGAYTGTVALTFASMVGASGYYSRVVGYNSSHDDNPTIQSGNQPTYAVGSGSGVPGITWNCDGVEIRCLTVDGAATSGTKGTIGVDGSSGQHSSLWMCSIRNFSSNGINTVSAGGVYFCEVTGCGGSSAINVGIACIGCWVHKNSSTYGILANSQAMTVIGNLVTNNTGGYGGSSYWGVTWIGNTFYGNSGSGSALNFNGGYNTTIATLVMNNIFAKQSGGVGLQATSVPSPNSMVRFDYNAFYNNNGSTVQANQYGGMSPSAHDVNVAINPFNSSDANLASETSPDWGLNNTASAGASLRAAGYPGQLPNDSYSTGYQDIGAFQHQDSGGGGGAGPLSRVFTGM